MADGADEIVDRACMVIIPPLNNTSNIRGFRLLFFTQRYSNLTNIVSQRFQANAKDLSNAPL